jgi:hypothetical protein
MKHLEAESFWTDWDRLTPRERGLFIAAVRTMNEAFAQRGSAPLPRWPGRLRIRQLAGNPGIFEMTWSFAGPDGRATFEIVAVEGQPAIKWRRIGRHDIFDKP